MDPQSGVIDQGLSQGPANFGDVIIVDAFGAQDAEKLEILIRYFFSSPPNKNQENRQVFGSTIPLLANIASLSKLSPASLSRILPSWFSESSLAPDYLASFIGPLIIPHWVHPQWLAILQSRLIFYQENIIEHCINFLKKNNESEALVHWTSDRQFCNSLGYKILALLRELELNYPLEGSQPIKNRQVALEFRWEIECCILFALLTEVENHLKNFMLGSMSKFILDTIKAYLMPDDEVESSEESNQESELDEDDDVDSEEMNKLNKILKVLIDQLDSNNKLTIFSFFYHVHRKTWSQWTAFERKDLQHFENRESEKKTAEPSLGGNSGQINTPRQKRDAVVSRLSLHSLSQGSNKGKKNTSIAVLQDTFKVEFWPLLLTRYGTLEL